jgi:hypothetical protein
MEEEGGEDDNVQVRENVRRMMVDRGYDETELEDVWLCGDETVRVVYGDDSAREWEDRRIVVTERVRLASSDPAVEIFRRSYFHTRRSGHPYFPRYVRETLCPYDPTTLPRLPWSDAARRYYGLKMGEIVRDAGMREESARRTPTYRVVSHDASA